nr:MAG TPA: Rubredoxin-like zinc ribbon domain protein [Caudoviricetes sp.]
MIIILFFLLKFSRCMIASPASFPQRFICYFCGTPDAKAEM